jgi:hypothetical protein
MILASFPPIPERLDICLPKVPSGGCYQLLFVGGMRRQPGSSMEFEIGLFFQFRPSACHTYTVEGDILQRYVHYHHAPLLVAGSLWTEEGKLIATGATLLKAQRSISFGEHVSQTSTFSNLFSDFSSMPIHLHPTQKDSWCMVLKSERETILIPCFEILRALFYRVEAILLDLFFSQLPLKLFCSVDTLVSDLAFPISHRHRIWRVEIKVSSHRFLSAPSIRVLAELACNAQAYLTLLKAQTYQFNEWASNQQYDPYKEVQFWISPLLGHSVKAHINGRYFSHGDNNYFLADSFISLENFNSFRKILVQFLKKKTPTPTEIQTNTLLSYPDLFSLLRPEKEYAATPNINTPDPAIRTLIDLKDMINQQAVHSSTRWDFHPSPTDGSITVPGKFSLS